MAVYDNQKLGWIAKLALPLAVLFGASQSYAACTQSDMAGVWYFNGVSGDTYFGTLWETDFCKVKVNAEGKVRNGGSQCKYRDADGKGDLDIQGGNLTLNSSCSISGRIKYCIDDFCISMNIDDARLDKGKTVVTLVGRLSIDPDVVSYFTGVKK